MSTGRLVAALVAVLTLSAAIAAAGSSATAQPTAHDAVLALDGSGVLSGTNCSVDDCEGDLARWEAAVWFTNALDLSPGEAVSFRDVPDGSKFAVAVSSLYGEGVTAGCTAEPLRYCPDDYTTRAQMASFLTQAFDLAADDSNVFADVDPVGVHARSIAAVWEAGIADACGTDPLTFCPAEPITRRQAALWLERALKRQSSVSDTASDSASIDSASIDSRNGPTDPSLTDPSPTDPAPTVPSPTDPDRPTSTVPTSTTTTAPPVRSGCAVVDHFNTHHDIDDHGGDPAKSAWVLVADGTLFAHRHLPGGGALCWMWAPSGPGDEPSHPVSVPGPSHTH